MYKYPYQLPNYKPIVIEYQHFCIMIILSLLLYFYVTWFHRSVWSCSISEISGDFPDQPITQYLSPWQFPWEFRLPVTQCAPYAGLEAVSGTKWVTWFSTIAPLSLSAWWSYLLPNSLISITAEQGKKHTGMYVKGLFTFTMLGKIRLYPPLPPRSKVITLVLWHLYLPC